MSARCRSRPAPRRSRRSSTRATTRRPGRELRLRQEYFFVSASLQDLVRRHLQTYGDLHSLPDHAAIQLNDTHPSIAVAELMRLLIDVHGLPWDEAWRDHRRHLLLHQPHAAARGAGALAGDAVRARAAAPSRDHLSHQRAASRSGARTHVRPDRRAAGALADRRADGRHVRMGHLAFVGSHRVNGVSALHTELMRETVFADLHRLYPERIVNKTNGITFRRWLHQANPRLTRLLREVCGDAVLDDTHGAGASRRPCRRSRRCIERLAAVKRANKIALAPLRSTSGSALPLDPDALFDVQIKRIHEYKRQLLNLLETVALYHAIRADPDGDWVPRVKIFAGKAAPSYRAGQADHQARQRHRRRRQQRSAIRDLLQARLPAELQCQPRRGDHSRRPICPSRSRPPAWRPRAPAT